jgi:L-aspartate oxidase
VRDLGALGGLFHLDHHVQLALARDAVHGHARVVLGGGEATGAEIERALVAAVEGSSIDVRAGWFATELLVADGRCSGVVALRPDRELESVLAAHVVLATGGVGQCFAVTTNPPLSTGDGVALALKAGVACADLEFVQFHPTALHHPSMPRPLLSEALRGEGAVLRDIDGVAFMADVHPRADLAPRDIVARAIHERMQRANAEHLWLDATMIDDFPTRFPTIWEACRSVGLDPTREWLPVAPAAHYLSGGVVADLDGATTLPHLWACGETACSGVHGANRLASNSLLDGLVYGRRVVGAIVAGKNAPDSTGAMHGVLDLTTGATTAAAPPTGGHAAVASELRGALQRVMSADCGVARDPDGLKRAAETLVDLTADAAALPEREVASYEVLNLLQVARRIVAAATAREESRGAHFRTDVPFTDDRWLGRLVVQGEQPPRFVALAALAVREQT